MQRTRGEGGTQAYKAWRWGGGQSGVLHIAQLGCWIDDFNHL